MKLIKKFKALLIGKSVLIKHSKNPIQDYLFLLLPSSASSIGFLAHNKEIEHTESLQVDRVAKVILILWIRRQPINHPDTYVPCRTAWSHYPPHR